MQRRRRSERRGLRSLGIGFLILSTIHVPLPQADYHNVRHHDKPGEICPYHDHLLRWHPQADSDDDVALLHWHWFVPLMDPSSRQSGVDDEQHSPNPGPSLHAHLGDWPEPDWSGPPVIQPDSRGRLLHFLSLCLSGYGSEYASGSSATLGLQSGSFWASPPGGALSLCASRTILFQRWNC